MCAIPLALILVGITTWLVYQLNPGLFAFLEERAINFTVSFNFATLLYIIGIFVFMLIHEFIHAVLIPNFIKSDKTFWGINGLFGFVFTTEPIKKRRYIIISFMPCILLSIILPILLDMVQLLNGYMAFLCVLNAMGSCVDFLNVVLIVFQVPNNAVIINNGFETYYSCENKCFFK